MPVLSQCRAFLLRSLAGKPMAKECSLYLRPPFCMQLFSTLLPSAIREACRTAHLFPRYWQHCPHPVLKEVVSPYTLLRRCVIHLLGKCHSQNYKHVAELNWSRTYIHAHTLVHAHTLFLVKVAKGPMFQNWRKSQQSGESKMTA